MLSKSMLHHVQKYKISYRARIKERKSNYNKEVSIFTTFVHYYLNIEIYIEGITKLFWTCLQRERCAYGCFLHIFLKSKLKNSSLISFNNIL